MKYATNEKSKEKEKKFFARNIVRYAFPICSEQPLLSILSRP